MRRLIAALVLLALPAAPLGSQEPAPLLRAGAAAANITPPLGEPIVGGWGAPPATHIHDELHARCLVLDDGRTRLAFAICDNVGIPREVFDEARRLAHEETEIPEGNLLFSSTHTHSATSARPPVIWGKEPARDYARFLARRIADGIRRAVHQLEPARISRGSTQAPGHLFNRRYFLKEGVRIPDPFGGEDKVLMNPGTGNADVVRPAGPTDPQVSFLSVRALDGRPIALLANYSLHYVGGVPQGEVSADYFAVFADRVQQLFHADRQSPAFVGIMTNGTSGDVNNIDVLGAKRDRQAPYEQMRAVAFDVAAKVAEAEKNSAPLEKVRLAAGFEELGLEVRRPTPEQVARAKEILARPKDAKPGHVRELAYAQRTLQMAEGPEEVLVPIQVFRIGDLAIAAIPFEVFTDIGLEIRKRAPAGAAFTISLANGSYGYLPTPEHHALGGYETWLGTSRVETRASVKITAKVLELMESLK